MQKFPSEYGASLVVAERDRKTIFFLCSVSMVKKVKDGGEWERGSARRAHITWNKVKLIETNCSSARASFTVNEICIVFVWKQAKRLAFFFSLFFSLLLFLIQKFCLQQHNLIVYLFSRPLCAEFENWFFTLLAATRIKQKCKKKMLN